MSRKKGKRNRHKRLQFSTQHSHLTGKHRWSFGSYKLSQSGCVICGYNKCERALQFHHLDKTKKKFTISSSGSFTYEQITNELAKTILVCSNCHCEIEEGLVVYNGSPNNA